MIFLMNYYGWWHCLKQYKRFARRGWIVLIDIPAFFSFLTILVEGFQITGRYLLCNVARIVNVRCLKYSGVVSGKHKQIWYIFAWEAYQIDQFGYPGDVYE